MDRSVPAKSGEHFQEVIASHQLAVHTELKRSTSLPTAMFDASDPMLEARLCEATEEIFRALLDHDAPPEPGETGAQRLEAIDRAELAALLQAARTSAFADTAAPELRAGAAEEFRALLAEICHRSHGAAQHCAARLLRADASAEAGDLDRMAGALLQQFGVATGDDDAQGAALAATCRAIAATVLRCTDPLTWEKPA